MAPDASTRDPVLRCPGCAAAVPAGAPWCMQCYLDLRPPAPPPPPAPVVPAAEVPLPRAAATPADAATPTWPCARCSVPVPLDADACAACGAGFLSALHDDAPALVLPLLGDVTRLGPAGIAVASVALVGLLVAVLALLGVLLR